jgi:hypothetical protein
VKGKAEPPTASVILGKSPFQGWKKIFEFFLKNLLPSTAKGGL